LTAQDRKTCFYWGKKTIDHSIPKPKSLLCVMKFFPYRAKFLSAKGKFFCCKISTLEERDSIRFDRFSQKSAKVAGHAGHPNFEHFNLLVDTTSYGTRVRVFLISHQSSQIL
jgi:hypothetical protein